MLSHRIERERKLVVFIGSGELKAAEVIEAQNGLRNDPAFDPGFDLLTDFREVTAYDFDAPKMRAMAANVPFGPASRRAIVVGGKLGHGFARMFSAYVELNDQSANLRVFENDLAAAERWLKEGRAG